MAAFSFLRLVDPCIVNVSCASHERHENRMPAEGAGGKNSRASYGNPLFSRLNDFGLIDQLLDHHACTFVLWAKRAHV